MNGVGPKVALAILSHLTVKSLIECIIKHPQINYQVDRMWTLGKVLHIQYHQPQELPRVDSC